jgi:hypothetical protein
MNKSWQVSKTCHDFQSEFNCKQINSKIKNIIKMSFTKIILSISTLLFLLPVIAQGAPPATPIDGGLSLLLVAGGAYGLKKLKDKRNSG